MSLSSLDPINNMFTTVTQITVIQSLGINRPSWPSKWEALINPKTSRQYISIKVYDENQKFYYQLGKVSMGKN